MGKGFKVFVGLSLIAFFVLGIYAVIAIGNISISFDGGNYGGVNEEYLAQRIAEELARQQDRLFLEASAGFAALDPDTLLGEFAVTALPKEYRGDSKAELTIQGQTVPMQWKDGALEARIALPLDTQPEGYRIALQSGGVTRVEVFGGEGIPVLYHGAEIFGGSVSYGGGIGVAGDVRAEREMDLAFQLYEDMLPFGDKAQSVRIFAEKEGREIFSKPMVNGALEERPTFAFEVGVPILIYAEVKGASGLTYRYLLQSALQDGNEFWITDGYMENETGPFLTIATAEGKTVELTR
ncbi:MAG: hypothetical protein LBB75_01130 [Oscillospiraceae bacterium]|nr:hypothetical protein [Oscillospiraceae bacterium]